MDVDAFLNAVRSSPDYRDQIVHVHVDPPRAAEYAADWAGLSEETIARLRATGVDRLYAHQAEAIRAALEGLDALVATGTSSGKSFCYVAPILEMLRADPQGRALLLYPTKALTQDQFQTIRRTLDEAPFADRLAGVYDGDTPPNLRRSLRDRGSVILTNPDMVHAALMPQHARWADFLAHLRYVVLDELHVYNGIFGANMANLLRRFERVCRHYGSRPQILACSATIGNPAELACNLTGRDMTIVTRDGSPRGRRVYVLWNPPRIRSTAWRSRRSANVEAYELMTELIRRGSAVITFSKAKMTAEMIHRYVVAALQDSASALAGKVTPYRGGYLPEERREIERKLFSGELLGVSTTRALELGIDVGTLDACIVVGYPGTLASFFQQAGRAGRGRKDALVVLVGLDTAVNQYVIHTPEYLFGRPVEETVIEPDNPFVTLGHLRCATHEIPLAGEETGLFGPQTRLVLRVLEGNRKVREINGVWYHAASETPQHEVSLRATTDRNVIIRDADTGETLGQVNKLDAPPILHPEAIYMHRGDTYRVLDLDLERCIATVKREEVDYYTQPLGGTDVHHVDAPLRETRFGAGRAYWGEVTAYFRNEMYEKVRFYELDAVSRHGVDLPVFQLETMAVWIVPPETLTDEVRKAGLDAHSGLRGIGYAMRMMLPLFITCDTLSFSHTVGSANSPWNAVFVYERHPLGLGYTMKAYERLHEILPAVLNHLKSCPCADGCPCCVGKPLRQYATWNVERGEASIPSKPATLRILEGLIGDGTRLECPDERALSDEEAAKALRLEQALRRRLERMREPEVFHPIEPHVPTGYPAAEDARALDTPDVTRRIERRRDFERDLRRRLAQRVNNIDKESKPPPREAPAPEPAAAPPPAKPPPIRLGDSIPARARRRARNGK